MKLCMKHICLLVLVRSKREATVGYWVCHLHAVTPFQKKGVSTLGLPWHTSHMGHYLQHAKLKRAGELCTVPHYCGVKCCVVMLRYLRGCLAQPRLLRLLRLCHTNQRITEGAPKQHASSARTTTVGTPPAAMKFQTF